ncbi:hypothetical protein INT48_005942 [Thamnidium elegans]|uniref:Uncharacterized protein n=1 Tax=Thamnidium elegans TaxID=101142 RepID=A0A8H7SNE4_9FUNG|nr:hypothetical protein INT48_005942 [Thamnidium elegans]
MGKFFDDQAVKIHFYSIHRQSLLYSKELLDVQDKLEFTKEQLAESQKKKNTQEEAIEETYEEADDDTNETEQKRY